MAKVQHINNATGRKLMRGLTPTSRHKLAGAMPFRPKKAAIPLYFFMFPKVMNMWGNDQYGDCVTAEEAMNKACAGIFVSEQEVVNWATTNDTLNGADLQPVIQMMQTKGFAQDGNIYGDGNGLAINYADAPTLRAAIYEAGIQKPYGGEIKIGVAADQLPSGAGNANGWFLTTDTPDQNEDHCTGLCGYGTAARFVQAINQVYGMNISVPSGVDPNMQGYAFYTWSTIGFVSVQALVNICGEAWIRNASTTVTGTGTPTPDAVTVIQPVNPTPPSGLTPTSVGIQSTKNPANPGDSVVFTTHAFGSDGSVPTGTMALADALVVQSQKVLDASGNALFAMSTLTAGSHPLVGIYQGDPNYAGSTSSVLNQVIGSPSPSGNIVADLETLGLVIVKTVEDLTSGNYSGLIADVMADITAVEAVIKDLEGDLTQRQRVQTLKLKLALCKAKLSVLHQIKLKAVNPILVTKILDELFALLAPLADTNPIAAEGLAVLKYLVNKTDLVAVICNLLPANWDIKVFVDTLFLAAEAKAALVPFVGTLLLVPALNQLQSLVDQFLTPSLVQVCKAKGLVS